MVVEIFVTKTQPVGSLRHQFINAVLNELGITQIRKTLREALNEPLALLDLTQQEAARVRGDVTAIERRDDRSSVEGLKCELVRATVCLHRLASPFLDKLFVAKHLYRNGRPFSITSGRVERWRGR